MVRREGTRFGVWTGHSLRRSVQSQKAVHSSQNIVVRASTDVKVKRAQKQASSVVENHLQNRSLNLKGFSNETVLPFSLNKNKRWEVVDALKKNVGILCCQGDRITVSEHHISIGNPEVDCTASYDSMSKFSPKKTYARAADLAPKETEPSTDQVAAQDKEFGTKNRRRRQKRKVKVDKVTGVQEEVFSVNVSYAVNVAPPKHTLHTFHRRNRTNGLDVGNGDNIALQVTKQGTKKRNKKVSGSILDDLDSVREYDAGEYYYDEEDDQEVMDESRCIPRSEVTAVFGMFVVDTDQQTARFNQKRKNPTPPSPRTKEHIFQIDLEEPQESGETPLEVEDNAVLTFPASTDNIQPASLRGTFSDDYEEAYSCPRRFSVNITDRVVSKVQAIPIHGSTMSDMLLSTGYQVFVIFCMPMQESSQHENISATVVGDRFNQMDAEKILYGYQGEIGCVSDAVDRITELIATKVKFRSYECKLSVGQKMKSRGVPLTTVADSLKWESEIWSQQRMWKRIIAHEDGKREEESRIEEEIPEDHAETCKICCMDISEAWTGTYLQPCNHLFCDGCWKHYLIARVMQGDPRIACPEFNCKVPVDRVIVMSLVPSKIASFHLQQKINAAVASDKHFQWCPNKGCQCMARFTPVASGPLTISCECGSVWCSKCMQEAHWPATCAEAATYRADKAYMLTCVAGFNEILVDKVRFKNCPECNNSIEKISGCDVVRCPCQCTFCWRCGDLDSNHNIYACKQAAVDYETFEFNEEPMEDVYQLSIMHHLKRSGIYSFKRNQLAHQLANKVAITFTLENGPGHCDRQATDSASSKALTFSVLRGKESGVKLLEEINNLFKKASDFLLEAYSVLEFLEIHLVSFPPCEQKRELYQRKTRIAFISQQLDDILNQRIGDSKGCVERVNMLYVNGKSCLFSLARLTSELSNMRETPINHDYRE